MDEIKNIIFKLVDDNRSFEGIIKEVGSDDPVGSVNKEFFFLGADGWKIVAGDDSLCPGGWNWECDP